MGCRFKLFGNGKAFVSGGIGTTHFNFKNYVKRKNRT